MSSTADVQVRSARPEEATAVAQVQVAAWRASYGELLPDHALDGLDVTTVAEGWWQSIMAPPSERHRLLVALDGEHVVGFAATAPTDDADLDPQTDAELLALHVSPDALGRGHGSRLLTAAVDHWRADGMRHGIAWVLAADDALIKFLRSAGWGLDVATRQLDAGSPVPQVRMHTDLTA